MGGQIWEVVGGADKGGILVRESRALTSPACELRLSNGALVEELALEEERLQFKKLAGDGPDTGWVSLKIKGKTLMSKSDKRPEPKKPTFDPYAILGVPPDATDAMIKSAFRKASVRCHPDRNPDDPDAAEKFRELTKAKEFLLSPLKRLIYNAQNRLIKPTVREAWWSDWDEMFDEMDPAEDNLETASRGPPASLNTDERHTDVLIMGATGLVGTLACMVMQRQSSRTWSIAGRNGRKLDLLKNKFGTGPCFHCATRAESQEDVEGLARTARIVVDFRGPMYQAGTALGEACVRAGTHYLVVSGDVLFNKPFHEKVGEEARRKRVCLSGGIGILASLADFGVWSSVKYIRDKFGLPTRRVDKYEHAVGQMLSGSMIATGLSRDAKQMERDIREGGGPFFLGGVRPGGPREEDEDINKPLKDPYSGMWSMPANVPDAHYVRCSCGMFDESQPWGDKFVFKNHTLFANKNLADESLFYAEWAKRFYQKNLQEKKVPPPGCGPNERQRQECFLTYVFVAEAEGPEGEEGQKVHCIMRAGPGGMADRFEGSATMALESAICLLDAADAGAELRAGWGTPTWHMAHLGFFDRLMARGIAYKMVDEAHKPSFFANLGASTLTIGDDA
eukprot:TRINITY_DN110140_c0_g1_i1.p1 TRINITY_DN110140_c0_g1~~TRINITY_DN110140_c0_g1_i1.p1  ORF type:complete len:622 (-),score=90.75 TRINITY_DN110140_c0_g1_i1:37-1902(-)